MKSLFTLFVLFFAVASAKLDWKERLRQLRELKAPEASDEEVLQALIEHDQKRARLLQAKLEAHQRRLKDHKTGSRRLTAAEHEQVSRQVKVFSDHVERLKSETHQHKLEKLEEHRESFDAMHAMDFIDFEKTGA